MANEVRIDKWLWAARIFKTRTIAAEACKKGRICLGGNHLKPSRMIKAGDVIDVRKPPIIWSFKVLKTIEHRVGAKLILDILENVTSKEQLELLEISKQTGIFGRDRGTGRPTKKDRREIEGFTDDNNSKIHSDFFDFGFDFDTENESD